MVTDFEEKYFRYVLLVVFGSFTVVTTKKGDVTNARVDTLE
jgi:hypothetical protein